MIDLKPIRAIALDVVGQGKSYESQDEIAEFIWGVLNRGYSVYLFTSDKNENLSNEDFSHQRLSFIEGKMPPGGDMLAGLPVLGQKSTLWVTSGQELTTWLAERKLPYVSIASEAQTDSGHTLARLSELGALLDPTRLVLDEIGRQAAELRERHPGRPMIIGVGGPPLSGFAEFSLDLKIHLQSIGFPLVELMNLTDLMASSESVLLEPDKPGPWGDPRLGAWLMDEVFSPLKKGERVYKETPPVGIPADKEFSFPLFISEETVLIIFAEMLFVPQIQKIIDIGIMLELGKDEIVRRAYEIPEDEPFDTMFVSQYQGKQGRVYDSYLQGAGLPQESMIRVNADHPRAFRMATEELQGHN